MAVAYRFRPRESRFTVQAFAGGLLAVLGHNPTFAVRDFDGALRLPTEPQEKAQWQISVRADSLELLDDVRLADRQEIEGRMRTEVLEMARYPAIRFEAGNIPFEKIGTEQFRLRIAGQLCLRGVTEHHRLDALLTFLDNCIRLAGETSLRLPDYAIRPVTALGGTLRLKDELRVAFDLAGAVEDDSRGEGFP